MNNKIRRDHFSTSLMYRSYLCMKHKDYIYVRKTRCRSYLYLKRFQKPYQTVTITVGGGRSQCLLAVQVYGLQRGDTRSPAPDHLPSECQPVRNAATDLVFVPRHSMTRRPAVGGEKIPRNPSQVLAQNLDWIVKDSHTQDPFLSNTLDQRFETSIL